MAGMKVTKPDGTIVEIDKAMLKSLSPEQLSALVGSLTQTEKLKEPVKEDKAKINHLKKRTMEEIWNSSKRERVGLFLANQYAPNTILDTTDIHRDWIETFAKDNYDLYIEKSHLTQYLTRLSEMSYLIKQKIPGRGVRWITQESLTEDYPQIQLEQVKLLIPQFST